MPGSRKPSSPPTCSGTRTNTSCGEAEIEPYDQRDRSVRRAMKLSDYVIDFLARNGVSHVFGISGGAAVHLFDSAARHPTLDYVCTQHEQSAAIAADGYARVTGKLGVAITTSGPGATKLLTGACCSYYDSIPTLMITGQVSTFRLKGDPPVRQIGFQETDVFSIFASVTKYAHQIRAPESIRYNLEKAYHHAFADRPGTVLIDIPDDLQRAEVDPQRMQGYEPPKLGALQLAGDLDRLFALLRQASRPVLVLGGGLATPRIGAELEELVKRLNLPVLLTWAGNDQLPFDHPVPAPKKAGFVDAYDFIDRLSQAIPANEPIFVDTGGNLTCTCNGLKIKRGQKLLSAWNNTPMGYALPAAIGAAFHTRPQPVTCIIGDGGLVLSLGELAVVARQRLPIRVILFNNHGHGIQKQTLETWLGARYVAVDEKTGLSFPDFAKVAEAMGLPTFTIDGRENISDALAKAYATPGTVFCNVEINPEQKLYPVLKFGAPLEDQLPPLDRGLLAAEMLVPPFEPAQQAPLPATAGV